MAKKSIAKAVLAYSGGLDTCVILAWLKEVYQCQIIAFLADLGQQEDLAAAAERAKQIGADEVVIEDLRRAFARDFLWPMLRGNAVYEDSYLLGTAIARPLIAARQAEIAYAQGADALAHGATGKGNDQIRFELTYAARAPDLAVIAPWREWDLASRRDLIRFAQKRQLPLAGVVDEDPPFSVDANLWHRSCEGRMLEDPGSPPPAEAWAWTASPEAAPDQGEAIALGFEHGDPVRLDGKALAPEALMAALNAIAGRHGVGRADLVENRFTGIKSRGAYETPGGTVLLACRRALEEITLDREARHLKHDLIPRYARMIYNGFWFAPERQMLQALMDESQKPVSGEITARLYKGNLTILARRAPHSLYSPAHATFEEDQVYRQNWAEGFIALQSLRLKPVPGRQAEGKGKKKG